MERKVSGAIAVMLLIMTAGCGVDSSAWVGTYRGEIGLDHVDQLDPSVRTTANRIEIEVQRNNQCKVTISGVPMEGEITRASAQELGITLRTRLNKPLPSGPVETRLFKEKRGYAFTEGDLKFRLNKF